MNARMSLGVKGDISFKDCKIIPISQSKKSEHVWASGRPEEAE